MSGYKPSSGYKEWVMYFNEHQLKTQLETATTEYNAEVSKTKQQLATATTDYNTKVSKIHDNYAASMRSSIPSETCVSHTKELSKNQYANEDDDKDDFDPIWPNGNITFDASNDNMESEVKSYFGQAFCQYTTVTRKDSTTAWSYYCMGVFKCDASED